MTNKVFLFELTTTEPVVITSNKGKSNFVETLRYIPASTILGAVAKEILLDNISNGLGECSRILDTSNTPRCDVCDVDNCKYRTLWRERKIKLTNAVFGEWTIDAPSVTNLQSIGESRVGQQKRDLLLSLFVESRGSIDVLLNTDLSNYKKKGGDVVGRDLSKDVEIVQFGRVSISPTFRTSEKGKLYGFTAIKEGQKFRFMVAADEEIGDCFSREIRVGAWKSRGMGRVKLKEAKSWDLEEYIEERSKQIVQGFDQINDLLEQFGVTSNHGTYIFLTDHTRENFWFNVVYKLHRIKRAKRYERKENGGYFILRDVVSAGSTGVFSLGSDPEDLAQKLATLEVGFVEEPWFDWIFFNHPVQYEKSLLMGVMV